MKILGIIAEYNPFHLGHQYHLDMAKQKTNPDGVIAVLSSNFLQRGEPALIDKWARTQMALAAGIDLVLELPMAFCCRSSLWFANGGVKILDSTGVVTHLAFGSETNQLEDLDKMANIFNSESIQFKEALKFYLNQGMSYPRARSSALIKLHGPNYIESNQPNSLLAISYLRIIKLINSKIEPILIQRQGSYNSTEIENNFLSASGIRSRIAAGNKEWTEYVSTASKSILDEQISLGKGPVFFENYSDSILAIIRRSSPNDLSQIIEMETGLENRVAQISQEANSVDELIKKLKTKRYTYTRIQRLLTHILLNFKQDYNFFDPQYLRVLGFNSKGKEILKLMQKKSRLPIITKFAHGQQDLSLIGRQMLNFEAKSNSIYTIGYPQKENRYGNPDYYHSPILWE